MNKKLDLSSSLCKRLPGRVPQGTSGSSPRRFHQGAVGLVKLGTGIILTKIQQSNLVGHAIVRHHSLGETRKCSGKKKGKPWECVDATFCSLVFSKTPRKVAEMVERSRTFHLEPSHMCHFGDLPSAEDITRQVITSCLYEDFVARLVYHFGYPAGVLVQNCQSNQVNLCKSNLVCRGRSLDYIHQERRDLLRFLG